ncbi:hypothetical protein Csa_019112 [Cucumis sativus]|uniref:Uncharacterized protein n=1 Tax=Cucumis sativus TaxID=3659 RepID=A0A0A0KW99_CUCSA|nr:hypothetical protein Csa_019112 [Cucumis sativus]
MEWVNWRLLWGGGFTLILLVSFHFLAGQTAVEKQQKFGPFSFSSAAPAAIGPFVPMISNTPKLLALEEQYSDLLPFEVGDMHALMFVQLR